MRFINPEKKTFVAEFDTASNFITRHSYPYDRFGARVLLSDRYTRIEGKSLSWLYGFKSKLGQDLQIEFWMNVTDQGRIVREEFSLIKVRQISLARYREGHGYERHFLRDPEHTAVWENFIENIHTSNNLNN